jgi:MFS transporter, DHA1 family, tetracycline resistance protein
LEIPSNFPVNPNTDNSKPTNRSAILIVFFILLLDVIGLMILAPVSAFIVRGYSNSAIDVTLLSVIYAAAQFFAAPLLGKLSDRLGRRPVILVSVCGTAIGYVIFGIGGALWILFLSRLISGITGGNMSACSAYIADVSKPEERAKNFALVGMAWSIGLVLGPAIGGVLGQWSLQAPAFAAALMALINLVLGIFLLPESLPIAQRVTKPMRLNDINPLSAIVEMARKPGLGVILAVLCLFNLAFNGVTSTESLFLIHKFNAVEWQVGLLLASYGIASGIVQTFLVGKTVARFGEEKVAVSSMLLQAPGALGTFFAPALWLIFPINIISRGINAFVWPMLTSLTVNKVKPSEQGMLMGVTTALGSLMNMFGSLLGGAIYQNVLRGSPFLLAAIMFVLAGLLLARQPRQSTLSPSEV